MNDQGARRGEGGRLTSFAAVENRRFSGIVGVVRRGGLVVGLAIVGEGILHGR